MLCWWPGWTSTCNQTKQVDGPDAESLDQLNTKRKWGKNIWGQIMPMLSSISIEVLSPHWLWRWENVAPPPTLLLCCFPLITDLLAIEVYQAPKSKQDGGPGRGRALYTGRALILSGLESKLQFSQLPAWKSAVTQVTVYWWKVNIVMTIHLGQVQFIPFFIVPFVMLLHQCLCNSLEQCNC